MKIWRSFWGELSAAIGTGIGGAITSDGSSLNDMEVWYNQIIHDYNENGDVTSAQKQFQTLSQLFLSPSTIFPKNERKRIAKIVTACTKHLIELNAGTQQLVSQVGDSTVAILEA